MPLTVEVVSADRVWWEGEARSVSAPALDGDLGILVGHQPILAVLRTGKIRIEADGADNVEMEVTGGFLSVDQNQVTVVVDPSTSTESSASSSEAGAAPDRD
ncbi:MAG TPA: F0F1 ATP synthase subunit epsilon [Beutenbergiaceae bacterium]|nr:F0F1 ATP synthase subunit epsilon [Beutenbergiaceae bacterium]